MTAVVKLFSTGRDFTPQSIALVCQCLRFLPKRSSVLFLLVSQCTLREVCYGRDFKVLEKQVYFTEDVGGVVLLALYECLEGGDAGVGGVETEDDVAELFHCPQLVETLVLWVKGRREGGSERVTYIITKQVSVQV